jgi:hypothetical protein
MVKNEPPRYMKIERPPLTSYYCGRMGEMSRVETQARWSQSLMERYAKGDRQASVSHLRLVHSDDGDDSE